MLPTCFNPLDEFSQDRGSSRCFDIIFVDLSKPSASSFSMLRLNCSLWNSGDVGSQIGSQTATAFQVMSGGLVILPTEL